MQNLTTALSGSPACKLARVGSLSLIRASVPYTVTLNNTHWKTIKAIGRQSAHPFVLIIPPPGLSALRQARHRDIFGIIFLMLQQPVQQKPTTDYSQRVSWLRSIFCDTLLYFNPPRLPFLFLLHFPTPHHLPFLFSHLLLSFILPFPSSDAFFSPLEWKKDKENKTPSYMFRRCTYKVCVAVRACVCAAWAGPMVNCMCASCLCASLRAAGNSKTRPYRPPRGLKAQGVAKQHGLNKKKKLCKRHKGGKRQHICMLMCTETHKQTHKHTQAGTSSHLLNPWLTLCSKTNIKHFIIHKSK